MRGPTSGIRLFPESRVSEVGIRLVYRKELNDNQAIKAFVEYNLGIAILSGRTVAAEVSSVQMRSLNIQGLGLQRGFHFVSRKNHSLSPPVRTFRSILVASPHYPDAIRSIGFLSEKAVRPR
jgi:DNA-binding transcriptional LysR family regulator